MRYGIYVYPTTKSYAKVMPHKSYAKVTPIYRNTSKRNGPTN